MFDIVRRLVLHIGLAPEFCGLEFVVRITDQSCNSALIVSVGTDMENVPPLGAQRDRVGEVLPLTMACDYGF